MLQSFTIHALPQEFAVVRLAAGAGLPWWAATSDGVLAWVRTDDEVSLVCEQRLVPQDVRAEPGYRALRVAGALPFHAIGVLASLAVPLADAGVPIFVVSTFDTDYILVPGTQLTDAVSALRRAGHQTAG